MTISIWLIFVLSRLAMCRFFAVNVKYRTYSSGACATKYYSCSHLLLRPKMSSGASVKLFNHLNVIALINIRSL